MTKRIPFKMDSIYFQYNFKDFILGSGHACMTTTITLYQNAEDIKISMITS